MTIHMLCSECGSALNVRDDLAGTVRHCPKCKVELHIPVPVGGPPPSDMELDEMTASSAGDDDTAQASTNSSRNGNSTLNAGAADSDDDDEHRMNITDDTPAEGDDGTAEMHANDDTREIAAPAARVKPDGQAKSSPTHGRKSSPLSMNEDEDFDPVAFLNETPEATAPSRRPAPPPMDPAERPRRKESADRPRREEPVIRQRREEPEPESAPVSAPARSSSISGASAAADLWDHAKAAKQLRKAMKEGSAELKQHDTREPSIDWAGMAREIGLKGVGVLLMGIVGAAAMYYAFDSMMGGGIKLPKLGHVEGTVTLDGQPVVGVTVYFSPVEAEMGTGGRDRIRTSTAQTDDKGHFRMLYIDRIAGVAVGRSRVWVSGVGAPTLVNIPPDYGEGSMVLRDVKEGSQTIDIEMKGVASRK